MKNSLLYLVTVFIWGTTWFAIEFQIGEVAVEASVLYRFFLAAILMWAYCLYARKPLAFSIQDHGFIALLALGNFSVNYVFMYLAQQHLTSAMTSIAFSTMLLMNIINTRIFFGSKISARTYIGACIGVLGIVALFWNDLVGVNLDNFRLKGLALVLTGTLIASFGNMVSVRNSRQELNIFAVNAWGMSYGCIGLFLWAIFSGVDFTFSTNPSYLFSLAYLSLFGTVIAFGSYFELLKNIGPERASYAVVLFPLVAVTLSSFFEGFIWTNNIILGFCMVILGNIIVLTPTNKLARIVHLRRGSF